MSGIFGLISKHPFSYNVEQEVLGMQAWNLAYGKISKETMVNKNYYIGCCLDKINHKIEINTPIIKNDSCLYAIDALIYNRDELLSKCNVPNNISDETLLISYINSNGLEALKNINGDFSGAIYDSEKRELTLFRDHMGIRPLFYYINDDFISFSTDIRGITGINRANITIDEEWIYKTLHGDIPVNLVTTEYSGVFCVKPGSYLKVSVSERSITHSIKTYWEPGQKKIKMGSDLEYQKKLKELITASVKRRLDVLPDKVGAELSGGLDSSVIDILINRLGRECLYFSWSYSPEVLPYADKDERLVIKDICTQEKISCNYKKTHLEDDTPIKDYLSLLGMPLTDDLLSSLAFPAYINTLPIMETSLFMNHFGVKVIFSGHGGDEGVSHRSNPYEMYYNHEYYHYLRYMFSTTHGQKHRVLETLKRIKNNIKEEKKNLSAGFIDHQKAPLLINQSFKEKMSSLKASPLFFAYDPVKYILQGGSRNRLDNTALQGACCNIRYVFPYLDYTVIDFAVSIPRYQFLRGRRNRYLFREAFKDIIPSSLYHISTKEDTSRRNLKPNPNWYDDYIRIKSNIVSMLKRDIWGKYLDFDKLEAFLHKEDISKEESIEDYNILNVLSTCILAQNALEKSREISLTHKEESNC